MAGVGCLPDDPGSHDLWCPGDNNYTCYKIPSLRHIPHHPSGANWAVPVPSA